MRKYILIAAVLIAMTSLVGCDMIKNINVEKSATLGDAVEGGNKTTLDGAEMTFVSSTAKSLSVIMKNNTASTWQSGNMRDYRLEAEQGGEWYEVQQVGELANTMELMIFAPGQTLEHTFEFSDRYGTLPAGKYRVVKAFWANATDTFEAHEFYLICEFTVE